jgi:hypothetical protein
MKHEIFKTNPNLKEVYTTSDGECFYNENDAKLHSKSLQDKKVELVLNPDYLEVVFDQENETPVVETPVVETPEVETPEVETPVVETPVVETPEVETPEVETPVVEAPVVEVKKTLAELNKMNKTQLIEFAKANDLKVVEAWTNKVMAQELFNQLDKK